MVASHPAVPEYLCYNTCGHYFGYPPVTAHDRFARSRNRWRELSVDTNDHQWPLGILPRRYAANTGGVIDPARFAGSPSEHTGLVECIDTFEERREGTRHGIKRGYVNIIAINFLGPRPSGRPEARTGKNPVCNQFPSAGRKPLAVTQYGKIEIGSQHHRSGGNRPGERASSRFIDSTAQHVPQV